MTTAQIPCVCYCSGWAKIHIRRPTGDTSWVTRLLNPPQSINDVFLLSDWAEESVPNLASVLIPKLNSQNELNFHPKLDRSVSASASLRSHFSREGKLRYFYKSYLNIQISNVYKYCLKDTSELQKESTDGSGNEEDCRERPHVARQTSLKELPSSSRKSCEAIPEESKEVEGVKLDDTNDLQPHPRERVYTMPALNMQRRGNSEQHIRRNVSNVDSASKDANMSTGTNPR